MENDACKSAKNVPGTFNRRATGGPFGIFGHDIEELIYNGESTVKIFANNSSVFCWFGCDV